MNEHHHSKGLFITFEGTEGAGKTTQISRVQAFLEAKGLEVVTTREPGGTVLGEKIRGLLLQDEMAQMTELLLMFAARAEHLDKVIQPAIDAGKWVLCDRFTESSYAYQGYARGISLDKISALESLVQGALRPHCTFWFDIPIVEGMKRVQKEGRKIALKWKISLFLKPFQKGFERFQNSGLLSFLKSMLCNQSMQSLI